MKIAVVCGSPKGKNSVTLRYVDFLRLHFPRCQFQVLDVGQQIIKIERNSDYLNRAIEAIKTADAVLWATPVYYLVVPAQLKRFIELIFLHNRSNAFRGKPAVSLTTSIHFFDHTAANYLHAVSEDLGMSYHGSYTAEMNDLLRRRERTRLLIFWEIFLSSVEHENLSYSKVFPELNNRAINYEPTRAPKKTNNSGKVITVITDQAEKKSNLAGMVNFFCSCFSEPVQMINLAERNITMGCRGCLTCGFDNSCFYRNRDIFHTLFEEMVKPADIIIIAGKIKDRFLSAHWKLFMDRSFYMNHVPYLKGKQIGIIIEGLLQLNANIREILEAYIGIHQGNLAAIVTDEAESSAHIDAALQNMALRLTKMSMAGYQAPASFLAVGGRKIFRDFIAGSAQVIFPADHSYYRKNHFFDYPHNKKGMRAVSFMLRNLLKIPQARKKFNKRIIKGLVQPFDRIVDREEARLRQ